MTGSDDQPASALADGMIIPAHGMGRVRPWNSETVPRRHADMRSINKGRKACRKMIDESLDRLIALMRQDDDKRIAYHASIAILDRAGLTPWSEEDRTLTAGSLVGIIRELAELNRSAHFQPAPVVIEAAECNPTVQDVAPARVEQDQPVPECGSEA